MVPVDEARGEAAWIYRDVTAIDSARRQAESEARSRSELLATISHDVRTPVVGIVGRGAVAPRAEGDGGG